MGSSGSSNDTLDNLGFYIGAATISMGAIVLMFRYWNSPSSQQHCSKILEFVSHMICHTGPCEVPIDATCFCKKETVKGELVAKGGIFSCNSVCGNTLTCGNHPCERTCHSGPCEECYLLPGKIESCYCGKTKLQKERTSCLDPIPTCSNICGKILPCRSHTCKEMCHAGPAGDCPLCSALVAKECIGGHVVLRNIPCHAKEIRCKQLCGKTRQCGMHACARICHPLPCDSSCGSDSGSIASCGQICDAPRRDCRHTCAATCHPCAPCPDMRCAFSVAITCSCGRRTATLTCGAGGSSAGGSRILVCNDDCAKIERKRVLADAFAIPPNMDALHFGENSSVSDLHADIFTREPSGGALAASALKTNPWKNAIVQDSSWKEDSWGSAGGGGGGGADMQVTTGRRTETPIAASTNRYNILDQDSVSTSTISIGLQKLKNHQIQSSSSSTSTKEPEMKASVSTSEGQSGGDGIIKQEELSEVVDELEESL